MGWKEEIDMMVDKNVLLRHSQVWQKKELTERGYLFRITNTFLADFHL